jgi:hypothetical protein
MPSENGPRKRNMATERYAILVKPYKSHAFFPVRFPLSQMPDGGYFEWDEAVKIRDRIRQTDPVNEYMIAPVIADPIGEKD